MEKHYFPVIFLLFRIFLGVSLFLMIHVLLFLWTRKKETCKLFVFLWLQEMREQKM